MSAVAKSYVEVLAISKAQMKPSWVTKNFVSAVRLRATPVLGTEEILRAHKDKMDWQQMREEIMTAGLTEKNAKEYEKSLKPWY